MGIFDRIGTGSQRIVQAPEPANIDDLPGKIENIRRQLFRHCDVQRKFDSIQIDDTHRQTTVQRNRVTDIHGYIDWRQFGGVGCAAQILRCWFVTTSGLEPSGT